MYRSFFILFHLRYFCCNILASFSSANSVLLGSGLYSQLYLHVFICVFVTIVCVCLFVCECPFVFCYVPYASVYALSVCMFSRSILSSLLQDLYVYRVCFAIGFLNRK